MASARLFLFQGLICLVIASSSTASGATADSSYRVGRITIVRRDVFDARRDGWFGRFANKFHTKTRESVIRNELLFKEGDDFDQDLIDETERNLRMLSIIGDVTITTDTVRNRKVNVVVWSRDRWTMSASGSYKQEGGVKSYGLNVHDDNFLGKAQSISLGYNYLSDRRNPHGAEFTFVEPRLFGLFTGARLQYRNSEDANTWSAQLERQFYSESALWAGGAYADWGKIRVRQYEDGKIVTDDYLIQKNQNAWVSRSFGKRQKLRLGLAYLRVRKETGAIPSTYYDRLDLINLSAGLSKRVFYKGRFIENFGRVEDVPLGYALTVVAGKNFHPRSVDAAHSYTRLDAQYSLGLNQRYYANASVSFSSFYASGHPRETTLEYALLQHWRVSPRTTLVGRVDYLKGYNWSSLRQLVLGSPTGLRGYSSYAFSGQEQFLVNLQYRMFPPISLWILSFGGAFFIDSGTAWKAGEPLSRQQFHTSIGFGLRIENSAQQGAGLVRIDFPFNLDERRFVEVIISSSQLIKAFSDLGFIPPNALR